MPCALAACQCQCALCVSFAPRDDAMESGLQCVAGRAPQWRREMLPLLAVAVVGVGGQAGPDVRRWKLACLLPSPTGETGVLVLGVETRRRDVMRCQVDVWEGESGQATRDRAHRVLSRFPSGPLPPAQSACWHIAGARRPPRHARCRWGAATSATPVSDQAWANGRAELPGSSPPLLSLRGQGVRWAAARDASCCSKRRPAVAPPHPTKERTWPSAKQGEKIAISLSSVCVCSCLLVDYCRTCRT